jgi:hypothetical protein
MELRWASSQESSSHRLWKWLASSSPFMELLWASSQESSSHRLWKWLASSSPIYGTALG